MILNHFVLYHARHEKVLHHRACHSSSFGAHSCDRHLYFQFPDSPFLRDSESGVRPLPFVRRGVPLLTADQIQTLFAQILILGSLFFIVIGLGFIASWFFFHTLLRFAEYIVKRIPLVRTIYKTCQDMINTIFTSDRKSFKQVVLVPFPNHDCYSIGLITREEISGLNGTPQAESVAVFVPTTPNPTSGFLMMYRPSDILYLDMKVEDAFKTIISCGVIYPDFKVISKEAAHLLKEI